MFRGRRLQALQLLNYTVIYETLPTVKLISQLMGGGGINIQTFAKLIFHLCSNKSHNDYKEPLRLRAGIMSSTVELKYRPFVLDKNLMTALSLQSRKRLTFSLPRIFS